MGCKLDLQSRILQSANVITVNVEGLYEYVENIIRKMRLKMECVNDWCHKKGLDVFSNNQLFDSTPNPFSSGCTSVRPT